MAGSDVRFPADHLDQRDEVGRVEGMADEHPLGMLARILERARPVTGGA
jgi:hypothetical protein